MKIDHVFLRAKRNASEGDLLREFGLVEGGGNRHPGQGTENRRCQISRYGREKNEVGNLITLTGRRLSRERTTMSEEDDATTVKLLLDLPEDQLKAILATYVEGSDDVLTLTTGKENGNVPVDIPLVEMAATVKRVEELKQALH